MAILQPSALSSSLYLFAQYQRVRIFFEAKWNETTKYKKVKIKSYAGILDHSNIWHPLC